MGQDCCGSFGGRVSIEVAGRLIPATEADITLDITNLEVEAKANADGSVCRTAKVKLFAAEIKFRDTCDEDWNSLIRKCSVNVTIDEIDNNRTHFFTGAVITGAPKKNLNSGEIEGLKIEGPAYKKV